ncbi:zona pellucida glycoprotein d [Trichomycterus rosablanca]|uniref:zona pellucida glycoprotein d n=1 Tax=Trichomycterus rosablanca TaxID=2290929 RepID=UPI002F35EB70
MLEGICEISHCVDGSRCIISKDGESCKCAAGYFGDLCNQDVMMNVVCGKDYITISVNKDFFEYYNVPHESVHLSNPDCQAKKKVIAGVVYYTVRTQTEKSEICSGQSVETNITHIVHSLVLVSEAQVYKNIVREPVIKIEYKCAYPYIRSVSLPFPVLPLLSEKVLRVDEQDVKVEMSVYKDEGYTEVFSSIPTMHFRDRVFVQVSVTWPADFFNLRVDECWATQTPKPNDTSSLSHTLLLNGCADDETVSFLTESVQNPNGTEAQEGENGVASTVRFSFEMFRFVMEPHELYLHCAVYLCIRDLEDSCVPECKSIIKREAARNESPQGILSYGPIKIEVPERPKYDVLLMVVLPVAVAWILALFLLILIALAKAIHKRLPPESP